ncbi:MAG TPA: hypothetical protein VES01_04680 [Dermatophilaceae bacterium]|nr:hypothetical protein [Dermatophilaceae bacterium]
MAVLRSWGLRRCCRGEVLAGGYTRLGFEAVWDEAFKALLLARAVRHATTGASWPGRAWRTRPVS